jgi:prepilin-type N-terminal cleavage/methylation domain-containing protein
MIKDMKRGFTIVELIIVITVMSILITISTINVFSSRVDARDAEREEDAETIALHLETYFNSGKDGDIAPPAEYPPTSALSGIDMIHTYLRDIDDNSITTPDNSNPMTSFIAAADNTSQLPTINQYIYQPLQSDGTLCSTDAQTCVKFKLYYRREKDNSVQTIKSKNQ